MQRAARTRNVAWQKTEPVWFGTSVVRTRIWRSQVHFASQVWRLEVWWSKCATGRELSKLSNYPPKWSIHSFSF